MAKSFLLMVVALAGLTGAPVSDSAWNRDTVVDHQASEQNAVYRRERFVYPPDGRRNPFKSLIEDDLNARPIFDNLDLVGVIFGGSAGSVATVIDRASEKRYRVRRGDVVGDARVVEIRPDAVVFQVTEFGVTRSETLSLERRENR